MPDSDTLTVNLHPAGQPTVDQEERRRRFAPSRPAASRRANDAAFLEAPARRTVELRERLYRRSLGLTDGVAALLAVYLAGSFFGNDRLTVASLASVPIVVVIYKLAGLYENDELVLRRSSLDEAPILFQISGLFALLTWILGDQVIDGALQPRQVLGLWGLVFAGTLAGRFATRALMHRLAATERCLVVGSPEVADRVRQKMVDSKVNASVVATVPLAQSYSLVASGGVQRFGGLVSDLQIDRVILAPGDTDSADMLEMIRIAKAVGVRVSVLPRMLEVVVGDGGADDLDGLTMMGIRRFGLTRSSRLVKRAFDLLGASVGLVAIAPILALLALAIRLDSGGPIFFGQVRVGRDGKRFRMIKFRSMDPDAEARKAGLLHLNEGTGHFKIAKDPRITRVGRFIRRTSLDELPQLVNVLRGEMSLVGPRPLVVDEDAKVEGMLRSRLHLTPGMTGPWQVLGSSRIPMGEMVKIDYLYVANWSLWADVKLLLRTVPYLLFRGGM
jgi:exopolysaccharide biosynthesis polyprenyl glycosylphosphotransferase